MFKMAARKMCQQIVEKILWKKAVFRRNFQSAATLKVAYIYDVTLTTGNKFGAGTDANVYVRFIGEKGSTDEIQLQTRKAELERGMSNSYACPTDDVGNLKKVIIRHDNTGIAPAWFLEKLKVKDSKGKIYHFECNMWLETSDPMLLLRESENITKSNSLKKILKRPTIRRQSKSVQKSEEKLDEIVVDDIDITKSVLEDEARSISEHNDNPYYDKKSDKYSFTASHKHKSSISPAVRNLIDTYGIDFFNLTPTGPHSRVLKGDVIKYIQQFQLSKKFWNDEKTGTSKKSPNLVTSPSESTVTIEKDFTDYPLSKTRIDEATQIAYNKFVIPHIYGAIKCNTKHFAEYLDTLIDQFQQDALILLLARAFADVIFRNKTMLNFGVKEINIDVCCAHGEFTLEDCSNKSMSQLYLQTQESASKKKSLFGLTARQPGGVMQLSTVLQPGQLLHISFNSQPLTLDTTGNPTSQCLLSLTCDGLHVSEKDLALLLRSMKQMIEKPAL